MMSAILQFRAFFNIASAFAVGFLLAVALLVPFDDRASKKSTKALNDIDRPHEAMRILCLVKTTRANHRTKADHVVVTWGSRCNKLLFVSDTPDDKLLMIHANVTTDRSVLTDKLRIGVDYVYKHHLHDFDWFLIVDDDAYVIMENLRQLLAPHKPSTPIFFGHMHKLGGGTELFFHGGNGYVMSREALRRFGTRDKDVYSDKVHHDCDDVEMSQTMRRLGVTFGNSLDSKGLLRFYCEVPEGYLSGDIPQTLFVYDAIPPLVGLANVSKQAIAFHHLTAKHMYLMEYLLYHLVPHGRCETE